MWRRCGGDEDSLEQSNSIVVDFVLLWTDDHCPDDGWCVLLRPCNWARAGDVAAGGG